MSNVSGIIKSIQDIMRKDVGVDGDAQRISQLVWMFFLKIFDDREDELALLEDDYKSPLPDHLRWQSWAKDPEGMTGDELSDFVNLQLFPTLKNKLSTHGSEGKRALVVRDVFEDAYNYMKSGTLMRQVINKICEIDFNTQKDRHTFGSIYEQILKDLQSAGNAGEFYTPRAVTKFIVNRVAPRLAETVLDPACGTGGFLTCTIEHKREKYVNTADDEETLQASIHGVEKKSLPYMLCVTNMILNGIDTPTNIKHDNTLSRPYKDYSEKDRVNVIVTNPPFGGMEEDGIENNFPAGLRTRETADLFVALIIKLLKKQGRAAVVLPDGFFFGEGMKTRLKEQLLKECNLHTIVRLPNGVFNPYTGIKTNLLFFTKGQPTEHIWYYEQPYPDGAKSYNKTKPMRFEEFQPEIEWWGNEENGFAERIETEQAWKISIDDIKARNYNLDIKNPHVGEQINHDPDELLKKYARQQQEISQLRHQLKTILAEALNNGGAASEMVNLITDHLDIWTAAEIPKTNGGRGSGKGSNGQSPYGIKKLRELILELAVRGKLVPQDPNDEPAGELLKKIAREKNRLVKEGKIKKQKPLPEIGEDEQPFDLPMGWEWVKLGMALKKITDGTHHSPPNFERGEFLYISAKNIKPEGVLLGNASYVTQEIHDEIYCRCDPEEGDILYIKDGATTGVATINNLKEPFSMLSSVALLKLPEGILNAYLLLSLTSPSFYDEMRLGMSGVAITRVTLKKLNDAFFPLPPFPEQHRIVSKVDELMVLCDTLKARLNEAQTTQIQLADAIVEQVVA